MPRDSWKFKPPAADAPESEKDFVGEWADMVVTLSDWPNAGVGNSTFRTASFVLRDARRKQEADLEKAQAARRALSPERERQLYAVFDAKKLSVGQAAKRFGVSVATIKRAKRKWKAARH